MGVREGSADQVFQVNIKQERPLMKTHAGAVIGSKITINLGFWI